MNALRKFVNRAPRYVLKPTDNHVMRYASDSGPEGIFRTKLVNLSETGAAFVVDRTMTPHIGEVIKVELPIPGLDQIAWYGEVVRMEAYSSDSWWSDPDPFVDEDKMLIAVHFQDLPAGHRVTIQKGLQEQFLKELQERRLRQQLYVRHWITQNIFKVVGYTLLSVACFGILYYLSRPSANYDPERGAPWGQRYKFFSFEKNQ